MRTQEPPTDDAPTNGETLPTIDLDAGAIDWVVPAPGHLKAATDDVVVLDIDPLVGIDPGTGDTIWQIDTSDKSCVSSARRS